MMVLNPEEVRFASAYWSGVSSVVVERAAVKTIEEYGDLGPTPTFVDVPRQRVTVRVVQGLDAGAMSGPVVGDAGELAFVASATGSDGGRISATMQAVVTGVRYELSGPAGATRTITMIVYGEDGVRDPLIVGPATDIQP